MEQALRTLSTHAIPVFLALTFPCALQAWLAARFGDSTPAEHGRLTWDPFKHVDLIGTIVLPAMFLLLSGATQGLGLLLGWGKEVPINPRNFRRFRRDLMVVESAVILGPLLLACIWAFVGRTISSMELDENFLYEMVQAGIRIGLVFFAIALLPLPPLPLGNAIVHLLPYRYLTKVAPILPWSGLILIGLLITGVLAPFIRFFIAIGALVVLPIHNPF